MYYSWHSTYNPSWFFNDLIIGHNVGYHETHPEYAKLAADMAMEMDPVKQVEKVHMLQRMLYEDQACLPTFYYDSIWGVSNRVEAPTEHSGLGTPEAPPDRDGTFGALGFSEPNRNQIDVGPGNLVKPGVPRRF